MRKQMHRNIQPHARSLSADNRTVAAIFELGTYESRRPSAGELNRSSVGPVAGASPEKLPVAG